jgi:hypothetical protein
MTKTHSVSVEDHAGTSLQTRTYLDEDDNVDLVVISDGPRTIVALPKATTGRRPGIDTSDVDCLAKCINIDDLEKRLNCILLCPAATAFEVYVRVERL